jgi:hypothetical protein
MVSDMRRIRYFLGFASCLALVFGLASGCSHGPTKADITGKVLKDGQPLKIPDPTKGGKVEVTFVTANPKDVADYVPRKANADDQGNFEIKGLPLGKYKVGVRQMTDPRTDQLDNVFNTKNTPIVRDVESSGQYFEIDLGKEAPKDQS